MDWKKSGYQCTALGGGAVNPNAPKVFLLPIKLFVADVHRIGFSLTSNFRVAMLELLEQSVSPIRKLKPTHKRLVSFRVSNEQSIGAQEWHLCVDPPLHYCHTPEAL